jgi:hypothetical protein
LPNGKTKHNQNKIYTAGTNFVSLVGTEDWVARNQVSSSSTFFLDIVSVLEVAYLHITDQRIQLPDKRSASLVGYA